MNENRIIGLLFLLGASGALYYWSTTQSGSDAIASAADDVGDFVSGIPRGVRNNNPGNIIRNGIAWQGLLNQAQVENNGDTWDPKFCQFDTYQNGLRALARILINYAKRGDNTINDVISTFAPASENDTAAYINAVSALVGVQPGQTINVVQRLAPIMAGIVEHENGEQPYTNDAYIQAIAAASQG